VDVVAVDPSQREFDVLVVADDTAADRFGCKLETALAAQGVRVRLEKATPSTLGDNAKCNSGLATCCLTLGTEGSSTQFALMHARPRSDADAARPTHADLVETGTVSDVSTLAHRILACLGRKLR
jgi:hypothetical protein